MSDTQTRNEQGFDDRLTALLNNAAAARAVVAAVTTAAILAGELVARGVDQIVAGVPVTRLLAGIELGIAEALAFYQRVAEPVSDLDDPRLRHVTRIAARGNDAIADLILRAAHAVGRPKLLTPGFRLMDQIVADTGLENRLLGGVVVNRFPLNEQMPRTLAHARILVVDDALEPERLENEALATDAGFQRYLALREEFMEHLHKLAEPGVTCVLVDRGVSDEAEALLTKAGVMVLPRVLANEWQRAAEFTGARPIKRSLLRRPLKELAQTLGTARQIDVDEGIGRVCFEGGAGTALTTVLIGASTPEVTEELGRTAKDAAGALQAALKGGVVPGGGAVELGAVRALQAVHERAEGMMAYGVACVMAALRRPLAQIVANAGYHPLEKLGDALAVQTQAQSHALGVNCLTGQVADMAKLGVYDPLLVKVHALRSAGEVARAPAHHLGDPQAPGRAPVALNRTRLGARRWRVL